MDKSKSISIPFAMVLLLSIMSETYSLSTVYNLYPSGIFIMACIVIGFIGFLVFVSQMAVIYKYFKGLLFLTIIFIIYCFININMNQVSLGEIYIFLKDVIYILFAVWFLFFKLEREQLLSIKVIMEKFFYIQIPMIVLQYIYYNFILGLGSVSGVEDLPVALMGKQMTGHIGVLTVFIGIDVLDKYYETKKNKELIKVIILFVLQFVLSVKVAIILWIVAIIYVFKKHIIRINLRNTVLVISLIAMIFLIPSFFTQRDILSSNYLKFTENQIINFNMGYENVRLSRISGIIITLEYLDNTTKGIFLGNGMGTTRAAYQFDVYGKYYSIFSSSRFLGLLDNSFNPLFYEIGIVGLLIIVLYILSFTPKQSKSLRVKIFIFCSLIFYTRSLENNFLTVYMSILLALSLKEKLKEKNLLA